MYILQIIGNQNKLLRKQLGKATATIYGFKGTSIKQ